jgi:hypothetical protein
MKSPEQLAPTIMSQIKKYKPNIKRRFRIKHSQMMTMIGWPTPSQQAPMPNPQKILQHEEGLRMEGEARVGAKAGLRSRLRSRLRPRLS